MTIHTRNGGHKVSNGQAIRTTTPWYFRIPVGWIVLLMWFSFTASLACFAMAAGYFYIWGIA